MKNPRVQFREAQTPTLLGKARLKEDSLWRQTAPLGRYSIWNPRVQLDRLESKIKRCVLSVETTEQNPSPKQFEMLGHTQTQIPYPVSRDPCMMFG